MYPRLKCVVEYSKSGHQKFYPPELLEIFETDEGYESNEVKHPMVIGAGTPKHDEDDDYVKPPLVIDIPKFEPDEIKVPLVIKTPKYEPHDAIKDKYEDEKPKNCLLCNHPWHNSFYSDGSNTSTDTRYFSN
jgi:hypothetical protein